MAVHIEAMWTVLGRPADPVTDPGRTSRIALPAPYVVPGGRFREIYYWDSFFTMEGLLAAGRIDLVEGMLDDFAVLIGEFGFIPNGTRTYYLGRSQPPFFAAMIESYGRATSPEQALRYLPALEREYGFWMRGRDGLSANEPARERCVCLPDGTVLNRHWDAVALPRPESHREDALLAAELPESERPTLWRHLRAAAESGWDFSSRWLRDGRSLATIATTDIVPVDLNCLLAHAETVLSQMHATAGHRGEADRYAALAAERADAIGRHLWDEALGLFGDRDLALDRLTGVASLAGVYPLAFGLATPEQAASVARILEARFLGPGGLVTTLVATGQQWDAPNGWPPLQHLAVRGLETYGFSQLAAEVRGRWLRLNREVHARTGRMMEKYDVLDLGRPSGGGEYPTQDGFGWTNGVAVVFAAEERAG